MLISGAVLNVMRLARWAGDRTLRDPLVLILHVAFVFVPIGFLLAGLAVVLPETVPSAAGIHAFSVGAVACMTLAVMTRATLGHTGRELRAGIGTCAVFVAIVLAAIFRIGAAFVPAEEVLLHMSATSWVVAFLGYAALFGGMLVQPKLRARQPNKAPS